MSVATSGAQATGESFVPSLNSDGRFIAFSSVAGNLVDTDLNGSADTFVHERSFAAFTLTPVTLNFGNQGRSTTSPTRAVQLRNTGNIVLPLNSIALGGSSPSQFTRTTNCGTSLTIGTSCQINVAFKPTSTGVKSATLSVNGGSTAGTKTVALRGTGVTTSFTLSPASITFANQMRNTSSAPRAITLINIGTAPLPITSHTVSGANAGQFLQTTTCGATVAVGGKCTIRMVFNPTSAGAKTATFTARAGGGAPARMVALNGTGL